MTFEMALAIFIIVAVIGLQLTIYRAKWGEFFKALYELILEIIQTFQNTDWEKELAKQKEKQVREPFTWERFRYQFAMPLLFLAVFPVYYVLMRKVDVQLGGDMTMGAIVICAFVIISLVMLVLYVYGQNEKNIVRKFWLELIVALFVEIGVVFDFHLLVEGYYFESVRGAKSLAYSLLFIPVFLSYCRKTNQNWKAWQNAKKSQKDDTI